MMVLMRLSCGVVLAASLVLNVSGCTGSSGGLPNAAGRSGVGGVGPGGGMGGAPHDNGGSGGGGTVAAGGMGGVGNGGASGAPGKGGAASGGAGGQAAGTDSTWAEWPMPNGPLDVDAGAPNPETYTDNGDQTVTDDVTGLMWQKTVPTASYTVAQASSYCSALTLAGYDDWRLPTRIQLASLVDVRTSPPCIDTTYFPGTLPVYFATSSAPTGASASSVFLVNFDNGSTDYLNSASMVSVRCARGASAGSATGGPAAPGRYSYPATGTVYDTKTKLTWQQTVDSPGQYLWADTKAYCAALGATLGGTGWRAPTLTELQTLVDESRSDPSIDPTAFPADPAFIMWCSSPVTGDPSLGWTVNFDYGNTSYYHVKYPTYVRCVR